MISPSKIFKHFEIPIDYCVTRQEEAPYLVYRARGSRNLDADDRVYYKDYKYTLEYYFRIKDEELEDKIENRLDEWNVVWGKSEDILIEGEDVFVIYYYI